MAFVHDDSAKDVGLRNALAGERGVDSPTQSYMSVAPECTGTVISAVAAQTIGGGVANDTLFFGVHIVKALTGTCVVAGLLDNAGSPKSITFPIGSVGYKEFPGVANAAGALTVTCADAADDDAVVVFWRPKL